MAYDRRIHHRRSIRLQDYDYSHEGAYFVTICTQGKALLFGDVEGETMRPNDVGEMIQLVWDALPQHYPGVDVDACQLMPNHLHGVIVLYAGGGAPGEAGDATGPTDRLGRVEDPSCPIALAEVIKRFKSFTAMRYREGVRSRGWRRLSGGLWQRNYYEHIVRHEDELNRVRRYILENPIRWQYDRENPNGWEPTITEAWEM